MRLREALLQAAAKGMKECWLTNKGYPHDSKRILDIVNTPACKHSEGNWVLTRNDRQELVVQKVGDPTTFYLVR